MITDPCDPNPCSLIADSDGTCNPSGEEYSCGCELNFTWDAVTKKCDADTRTANCPSTPDNSTWNDVGKNGTYTQTWNGIEWAPDITSSFNLTAGDCHFICEDIHEWNGTDCLYDCSANSLSELKTCVQNATDGGKITITADIVCGESDYCCQTGDAPLIDFSGFSSFTFDGGGHKITRARDQLACKFMRIHNSSGIILKDLSVDENAETEPCDPLDTCPETVRIAGSNNISFQNISISNSKYTAIQVRGTDGFSLNNSTINKSGIYGINIGHVDHDISRNISITGNSITNSRGDGIVVAGLTGSNPGDNVISENTVNNNYRYGLWDSDVEGKNNGPQINIMAAEYLNVEDNTVGNGHCLNCINSGLVYAVSLGINSRPQIVKNTIFSGNLLYNHSGTPVQVASTIDSTVAFNNNRFINNGLAFNAEGASLSGNTDVITKKFNGFDSPDDFIPSGPGQNWNVWSQCADNSVATKWCSVETGALSGDCVLRMESKDWTNTGCEWSGIYTQGMLTPISEGQTAYLSMWTRNGVFNGNICLIFLDELWNLKSQSCTPATSGDWNFYGSPYLEAVAPAEATQFQVRIGVVDENNIVDIENIRIAY